MIRHRHVFVILAFVLCSLASTRVTAQLIPRTRFPKPATITKPAYDTRLTVKFRDDLKVRAVGADLTSLVSADVGNVRAVQTRFSLSFKPMIQLPAATVEYIETRAAQRSGIAQPDLAGMVWHWYRIPHGGTVFQGDTRGLYGLGFRRTIPAP